MTFIKSQIEWWAYLVKEGFWLSLFIYLASIALPLFVAGYLLMKIS